MNYVNVDKELNLVISEDRPLKPKDLYSKFTEFISMDKYKIIKVLGKRSNPYEVLIENEEGRIFYLVFHLKNITGAGWKNKPRHKRIQVENIKDKKPNAFIESAMNRTIISFGYYDFDDNPIMVAWDAYRYINHRTIRSCYVTVDTLLRGYQRGYYEGMDSSQKLWVFNANNFDRFLNEYIKYNL